MSRNSFQNSTSKETASLSHYFKKDYPPLIMVSKSIILGLQDLISDLFVLPNAWSILKLL